MPVEVRQQEDVATGGVHQLKQVSLLPLRDHCPVSKINFRFQGQQRRLIVGLSLPNHGAGLPIGIDTITSVSIGCVCLCEAGDHRSFDSYQASVSVPVVSESGIVTLPFRRKIWSEYARSGRWH